MSSQSMLRLSLFLLALVLTTSVSAQKSIRQIDFKNFSYPWTESNGAEWLDPSEKSNITLVHGRWQYEAEGQEDMPDAPFSGLTFEEAQYADVTGDGRDDAIVVLRFDTGGTMYSHYVYVYSLSAGGPKLLAGFHCGDRAYLGLYRVYGKNDELVIELYDENRRQGDCCSDGFIRSRYKWRHGQFEMVGKRELGDARPPSRLPVTIFGTHR